MYGVRIAGFFIGYGLTRAAFHGGAKWGRLRNDLCDVRRRYLVRVQALHQGSRELTSVTDSTAHRCFKFGVSNKQWMNQARLFSAGPLNLTHGYIK